MKNIILKVEGMSCSHCVNAIEGALGEKNGIDSVKVSLENKTVEIFYDEDLIDIKQIKEIIEDEGYDVL